MPTGHAQTRRRMPPTRTPARSALPMISRQVMSWPPMVRCASYEVGEHAHARLRRRGVGWRGLSGRVDGHQPLDVLRDDVDLEVDRVAGLLAAERGEGERGRDQADREASSSPTDATVSETPSTVIEPFSTT